MTCSCFEKWKDALEILFSCILFWILNWELSTFQWPEISSSAPFGKSSVMFEKFVKCKIRNSKGLDGSIFVFGTFSPTWLELQQEPKWIQSEKASVLNLVVHKCSVSEIDKIDILEFERICLPLLIPEKGVYNWQVTYLFIMLNRPANLQNCKVYIHEGKGERLDI